MKALTHSLALCLALGSLAFWFPRTPPIDSTPTTDAKCHILGSCGGIHLLGTLNLILRVDSHRTIISNETRNLVHCFLVEKVTEIVSLQASDGLWSMVRQPRVGDGFTALSTPDSRLNLTGQFCLAFAKFPKSFTVIRGGSLEVVLDEEDDFRRFWTGRSLVVSQRTRKFPVRFLLFLFAFLSLMVWWPKSKQLKAFSCPFGILLFLLISTGPVTNADEIPKDIASQLSLNARRLDGLEVVWRSHNSLIGGLDELRTLGTLESKKEFTTRREYTARIHGKNVFESSQEVLLFGKLSNVKNFESYWQGIYKSGTIYKNEASNPGIVKWTPKSGPRVEIENSRFDR